MTLRIPIPSILLPRPARFAPLTGLASACLVSAALLAGGCSHDHGDRYDRAERVERIERYPTEPAPPPPVEETVVEEPAPYTPPPTEVTTVYEQDLNPYGHWVEVREYGRCWVPNDRPSGWRPYTVGHWVYTSEGTCWVAEEREADWGNVCYHYGRWYEDPGEGWVWVPGTTYAPNWCAWREGGGYCAWAPLPPQCGDGPVSVTVIDRYVPEDRYVVVDERYIAEPHVYEHVQRNNVTIINKTTNITNIKVVNNTIINQGVPRAHVEKRVGQTIPLVQVDRVRNEAEARALARQGKPVAYAPPVVQRYAESHPPRPARAAQAGRTPSLDTRQREAQLAEQRARGNGLSAQQQAARQAELERQRTQGQLRTQGPPQPQRVSPQVTAQERAAQDRASKQAQGERQRLQGYNPGTATPQRTVQERAIPNRSVPDRTVPDRTAQERAAQERAAQQAEVERQREQQRNQQQIQNRNASQDQLHSAFDKAAREQQAQDRAAQERAVQERAAQAKTAAQERAAQERAAQERVAQERVAQERVAQERVTQDRTAQAAQARAAQERAAQERAAQERSAQAAQERAAQQRAIEERQSARQPAPPAKTDSKSGKPGQNAQDVQDPRYPQR